MRDAFDELERQLRRAVAAGGSVSDVPRRHWRRASVAAVAAALLVSGGALAATKLAGGQSAETQGRKIAFRALADTVHDPACMPVDGSAKLVLSDGAALPAITSALPALVTPAPAVVRERALALLPANADTGRTVLSRTLRIVTLQRGLRLLVYVSLGAGGRSLRDPAACARARRIRATALASGRSPAVRAWADRRLAELRDTAPGLQILRVYVHGAGLSGSGSGTPIRPGDDTLRAGLLFFGSAGRGQQVYVGITGPRTTRVRVRTGRRGSAGSSHEFPVRQGFYAVLLDRHTGPARLLERAMDGTVLRVTQLHELPSVPR